MSINNEERETKAARLQSDREADWLPIYGYLVTTSPQSLILPWSAASPCGVGARPSGRTNSHGVTGGVYKARERIHRVVLLRDY